MMRVRKADPPSAVGGLEGIDKRVGSRGKKEKETHPAQWAGLNPTSMKDGRVLYNISHINELIGEIRS